MTVVEATGEGSTHRSVEVHIDEDIHIASGVAVHILSLEGVHTDHIRTEEVVVGILSTLAAGSCCKSVMYGVAVLISLW